MKPSIKASALLLPLVLACVSCNAPEPGPDATASANNADSADPAGPDVLATGDTAAAADIAGTAAMADDPSPASTFADANEAGAAGDGEALAMVAAVDEHEIAAAEQARAKGVDGDVLAYADLLYGDHSENLARTRALASPGLDSDSPDVMRQREKGEAELAKLAALEGDAYETAYVDAMVKGHTEALAMLDERLIPSARDEAIKAHLTATREHISMHLQKAKALQE